MCDQPGHIFDGTLFGHTFCVPRKPLPTYTHTNRTTNEINNDIGLPDTTTGQLHPLTMATILKVNQGKGRPKATSKIFEPIDDDTAISPSPCCATITEDNKSGTDVPAARIV